MAVRSFPFDDSPAYEGDWRTLFALLPDGVATAGALAVTADGSTRNLTVAAGVARVQGAAYTSDASQTIAAPSVSGGLSRVDLVVLRYVPGSVNGQGVRSGTSISLQLLQGTAAASPVAPTLTQVAGGTWECPLAQVTSTGTSPVSQASVSDLRTLFRASCQIDVFTASGTWTMPAGAKSVLVTCIGAGGSGAASAATSGTNASASGGTGGGFAQRMFLAAALGGSASITVGAGGTSVLASGAAGLTQGVPGSVSSFGSLLAAGGGLAGYATSGGGGSNFPGGAGGGLTGSGTLTNSQPPGPFDGGGVLNNSGTSYNAPHGGGGGGNSGSPGGGGSIPTTSSGYGSGAAGSAQTTNTAATGSAGASRSGTGQAGDGGGGARIYSSGTTSAVATGGPGGIPGGGGGGAQNQNTSGSGSNGTSTSGAGGRGEVIVVTLF